MSLAFCNFYCKNDERVFNIAVTNIGLIQYSDDTYPLRSILDNRKMGTLMLAFGTIQHRIRDHWGTQRKKVNFEPCM